MDELRALFSRASVTGEFVRRFRDERIERIQSGSAGYRLAGNGRLILHIVPHSAFFTTKTLDPKYIYTHHGAFWSIGAMGNTPRYNFDGLINERGGADRLGYTQVFRNGILEATQAEIRFENGRSWDIAGLKLEREFFERLAPYIDGLRSLGIDPPFSVLITLEGVRHARYLVHQHGSGTAPIDRDILYLPDCLVDCFGEAVSYHSAMRPAFDALWNAVGYPAAEFFDEAGAWVGPRR